MPLICLETRIAASPAACFALSLSVDAHAASMRGSSEKAVAGTISGEMREGDSVTWSARHLGIRWRMTSLISAYEAPHRFVDEQVTGPFARWRHEHRFEVEGAGTRMIDVVEMVAPCGVLGRLAERFVLEQYMTRVLAHRNRWLKSELEKARP